MKPVLLSICMPTFNRAEKAKKQLRYLLEETKDLEDVEIIVANNGSLDKTNEYIVELNEKYDFRYLRNQENIGVARNIKLLVQNATGKYIWIIGDDDKIVSGTIRKAYNILTSNSLISGIYINTNKDPKKLKADKSMNAKEKCRELLPEIRGGFLFITSNIVLTKSVKEIFETIDENVENFMSISMIYQFVAALNKNAVFMIIDEPLIINDSVNISWKEQYYKVIVRYNTSIFYYLEKFGYSKKEADQLAKRYYISENRRIFLEIVKCMKHDPATAMSDLLWYFRAYPVTTILLLISLPIRSLVYLIHKRIRGRQ